MFGPLTAAVNGEVALLEGIVERSSPERHLAQG
jgi:hypothetical protein